MISLNTSDDSSSDESDREEVEHDCCIDGLYVKRTKLHDANGRRHTFRGLFTSKPLKRGEFLGFYTGNWWDPERYERLATAKKRALDRYAVTTFSGLVLSPPLRQGLVTMKHPLAMMNEPNPYSESNAMMVEYEFCIDELDLSEKEKLKLEDRWDEDFPAVGLVMCKSVGKHKEILWTYGASYPRPYRIGKSCKAPRKSSLQDPLQVFEAIPPCAVPIRIK
jgi:hypothetical protein